MKLYNINNLFIGKVGNIFEQGEKIHLKETGYLIAKRDETTHPTCYRDVISGTVYLDFQDSHCNKGGQFAICHPIPLLLYIQKNYDEMIKIESLYHIVYKIINLKQISEIEINSLNFYFNNKQLLKHNENNTYIISWNDKKFINEPAIAADDKLINLMILLASDKKNPILIGNVGTGKNTLINEVVYMIQKNNCPKFLKKVKFIDISKLIFIDEFSNIFEEEFNNLINLNSNKEVIFVIKNIENLYASNTQVANFIKNLIDEENLKVIGITTPDKYNELIKENSLSKNFTQVFIDEPNNEALYEIINKTFNDYSKNNKIKLFDDIESIINFLIDITKDENRSWNSDNIYLNIDPIYNPGLTVEIIDLIFSHAKVNNQNSLNIDDIKYGIKKCDKIKEEIKDEYISKLDSSLKEKKRVISLKHLKIFDKE